jgi:drug/metabolite transporter (DMT)-like permease
MRAEEIFLVRFVLACACIWTISPHRLWCSNWKDEALMVLLGITGGSLYFLSENIAVGISYVNNVSFIVCTAPLWTTLLGLMFLKDVRASRYLFAGSLMAVLGMGMVIFNGHFILRLNPAGDLLALAAALCWAVYSVLIKFVSGRYSAVFITRKVFFYGILTIMPVFAVHPWSFPWRAFSQPVVWGNLLFLGILASFVCFAVWSYIIKQLGAIRTSNYVYLNPISTVIISALFLDEPMTPVAFAGSALILAGVYIANKKGN